MHRHDGIGTLLDLHGQVIDQGDGYWIKIEAWRVNTTREVPRGIRYSLTLHEPYGKRILGCDNAHAAKLPKKFNCIGRILAYDHKHRHISDKGVPYEFQDPYQLLTDSFADFDRVLQRAKKR
jgi:hypothetical protein